MKKAETREITYDEIIEKFNAGLSREMLVNYVSGITGMKKLDTKKIVDKAIYDDYMMNIKTK